MSRVFEGHLVSPKGRLALGVSRFTSFIIKPFPAGATDALVCHGGADRAEAAAACIELVNLYARPGAK